MGREKRRRRKISLMFPTRSSRLHLPLTTNLFFVSMKEKKRRRTLCRGRSKKGRVPALTKRKKRMSCYRQTRQKKKGRVVFPRLGLPRRRSTHRRRSSQRRKMINDHAARGQKKKKSLNNARNEWRGGEHTSLTKLASRLWVNREERGLLKLSHLLNN